MFDLSLVVGTISRSAFAVMRVFGDRRADSNTDLPIKIAANIKAHTPNMISQSMSVSFPHMPNSRTVEPVPNEICAILSMKRAQDAASRLGAGRLMTHLLTMCSVSKKTTQKAGALSA